MTSVFFFLFFFGYHDVLVSLARATLTAMAAAVPGGRTLLLSLHVCLLSLLCKTRVTSLGWNRKDHELGRDGGIGTQHMTGRCIIAI